MKFPEWDTDIWFNLIGLLVMVWLLTRCTPEAEAETDVPRVELAAGICKSNLNAEGMWWQANYPHQIRLTSLCMMAGAEQTWRIDEHWHLGFRGDFVNLGSSSVNAQWVFDEERSHPGLAPKYAGQGHGGSKGLTLGPVIDYDLGDWTLRGEMGIYAFRSTWTEQVQAIIDDPASNRRFDASSRGITPYVGLGLRHGWLFVSARWYAKPEVQWALGHSAMGLNLGVSIPLNP